MRDIAQFFAEFTPGAAGIWTMVLMLAAYGLREWRETRKLSLEDRIARREGYAKQVENLQQENRALRKDIAKMHVDHEAYRQLCHHENDQLRSMLRDLQDELEGLKRRVAQDALELARLKGIEGL